MKLIKVIGTAALISFLGATTSVYAQKGQGEKGSGKQNAKTSQHKGGQKAQSQQPAQHQQQARSTQQPRQTQQARQTQPVRRTSQPQRVALNRSNNGFHGNGNNGHHYGRISDASYQAHFGDAHSFRMGRPRMINGYNRFQYSGYWFGYNEPWPSDWAYTDNVYVVYTDDSYYLYNTNRPGIHITLSIF